MPAPKRREYDADRLRADSRRHGYTPEQGELLAWLLADYLPGYCSGDRLSLCSELRVTWSVIARLANGSYTGDVAPVFRRIDRLRWRHRLRPGGGLIETCVVCEMRKVADLALQRRAITMIWGTTGRSKTTAVRAWVRDHHDESLYVEVSTMGGIPQLMRDILTAAGRPEDYTHNLAACRDAVVRACDGRVLVLDEVARLLRGDRQQVVKRLDWLRELHEELDMGLVFVATKDWVTTLSIGALRQYLEQLVGRIADTLHIPDTVSWQEAGEIAAGLVPDPDADLVDACHRIANGDGKVRTLLEHIAPDALLLAADDGRSLTADDLQAVCEDRAGDRRLPAK